MEDTYSTTLTNIPGVTRTLSYLCVSVVQIQNWNNKSKYSSPVYFVPPSTFVLQCRTATIWTTRNTDELDIGVPYSYKLYKYNIPTKYTPVLLTRRHVRKLTKV